MTKNSYEHFYTEQTDKVKKAHKSKTERKIQREVNLRKERYGNKKTEEEIIKVHFIFSSVARYSIIHNVRPSVCDFLGSYSR